MTIEVEDIVPAVVENADVVVENADAVVENAAPVVENVAPVVENVETVDVPAKKTRGRPAGAKNKAKAADVPPVTAQVKKKAKVVVAPPPPSESESEEEPPPSPSTQRRNQWAAYRQKQVDNYQLRQAHYSKKLDKMLGF